MRKTIAVLLIAGWVAPALAAEDQADQRRRGRGRLVGGIVGAAGGFAVGLLGGLSWFDDAVDSERKIWTVAFGLAAAGGVGGYLIGRSRDGRQRDQRNMPGSPLSEPIGAFRQSGRKPAASSPAPRSFAELFEVAPQAGPATPSRGALQGGVRLSKGQYP